MDQNTNNQIPIPKPPKFQKIESNQISEQPENIIKSPESSASDFFRQTFVMLIGTGVIFAILAFLGWLCSEGIFCLGKYLPDVNKEYFIGFFIFLALAALGGGILLVGNLMFNKKAPYSTSKLKITILALFLFLIFLFIFNSFIFPFF